METKKFYLDYIFCYDEYKNKKVYFEGLDLGGDWNGWSRPAFPKEEADRIVEMINTTARIDGENQVMWFSIENDGNYYVERCEEGIYAWYDEEIVDGKPYYRIGTGSWCWGEWCKDLEKMWDC